MRIELVGGPACGDVIDVQFLNERHGDYRRRDRGLQDPIARERCFSAEGHRLYDYVKPDQKG